MNSKFQSINFNRVYDEYDTLILAENFKGKNAYQYCVRDFFLWLEEKSITRISKITPEITIKYCEYLSIRPNKRTGQPLSASYYNQNMFSLRMLFDYLLETEQIKTAIHLPKYNRSGGKQRQTITQEEARLLYDTCINHKERALISLAYGCGMRRSEIQNLNTHDVFLSRGMLVVCKGKNTKRREIPLSNSMVRYLKKYIVHERSLTLHSGKQNESAFFLGSKGTRMKGEYLAEMLHAIIQRTNNRKLISKEITLHCLRHSIAEHLINQGASIEFVRDFLGHSQIDTAHIYARRRKNKRNITL